MLLMHLEPAVFIFLKEGIVCSWDKQQNQNVRCEGLDEICQKKVKKLFAGVWLLMFLGQLQVAELTLLLSDQRRLRLAYRCLNHKGMVLDVTNYFISAPEEGLQCLVWGSQTLPLTSPKLVWLMLHHEKEPRESVADGKHVEH